MEAKREETVQKKGEQERGTLRGEEVHFKVLWRRGSSPLSRPTTLVHCFENFCLQKLGPGAELLFGERDRVQQKMCPFVGNQQCVNPGQMQMQDFSQNK